MQDREEQLFERFRSSGATDALAELYDLVAPELLHVALHLAGDPHRAEELLQSTLVAAIGPQTKRDAAAVGLRVDVVAKARTAANCRGT